jgi:hypothetical protein
MKNEKYVLDTPHFAPEYRYKGKTYLSPLQIIKEKGVLKVNPDSFKIINHPCFLFCPPNILIDKDIKRVESQWKFQKHIVDQRIFISDIANAMKEDALFIEKMYPDHTILALVGGKDSLNMLLLPWKNQVLVASAEPNYPLVKEFLLNNNLKFDLIKLEDGTNFQPEKEILINCCRLNLEHCRWTGHLDQIAESLGKKVIILKGQWGDNLFTDKWRRNDYLPPAFHIIGLKNKIVAQIRDKEKKIKYSISPDEHMQAYFFKNLWYESAHWQGVHMSFLHEYLEVPVLSMYHNANVMRVITHTDFEKVVTSDLRKQIGETLINRSLFYPDTNPSPPNSIVRKGLSGTNYYLEMVRKINIRVI